MAPSKRNNNGGLPDLNIDARTAVEVGKIGSTLAPIPGGSLISGGLTFVGAEMDSDKERKDFRSQTGVDINTAAKRGSKIARRKRDRLATKSMLEVGNVGATVAGSTVGAMAGSALLPFGGTLIGGAAGGMLADAMYGNVSTTEPDVAALARQMDEMQEQGIPVPKEMSAALLMASMDGARGKMAEDRLQASNFNTRDFNVAIQQSMQQGNFDTIRALSTSFENDMYAIVNPINYDPNKGAAGHLSEMIDSGAVRASDFVGDPMAFARASVEFDRQNGGALMASDEPHHEDPRSVAVLASPHQDVRALARQMNRQGVSINDSGELRNVPGRRGSQLEV